MKRLICFFIILSFNIYPFTNFYKQNSNLSCKQVLNNNIILSRKPLPSQDKRNTYMSLMYTNKQQEDYVMNCGIYNAELNKFKTLYSKKKHDYSDFAFDTKNNILYYSDLTEKKYNIFKINLNEKNLTPSGLLKDNFNGDIFDLYKNRIVFRMFDRIHQNHTIGTYDLRNGKVIVWKSRDMDMTIYNFYCNSFNNKIYTIERSLKEMHTVRFPDIPRHRIIQYNENGIKEKEIYSTDKFIHNISLDGNGNNILFDAVTIEDRKPVNKIYIINLNTLKENILLDTQRQFDKYIFTRLKMPEFSPDGKGFYFLGSVSDSAILEHPEGTIPITVNGIYYYKFSDKSIHKIFEIPHAFINNYKINQ